MAHRLRCLGGPAHGRIIDVDKERLRYPLSVPEHRWPQKVSYVDHGFDQFLSEPTFRTVEYRNRPIQLGTHCKVDVLVPDGMSEPEMYRRLADVIEGVGERTKP